MVKNGEDEGDGMLFWSGGEEWLGVVKIG